MSRPARVAWREAVQAARKLGLDADQVQAIIPIEERHGHCLWRIATASRSYVLKWFPPGDAGIGEIQAYALLRRLGVPTLAMHGAADDALLLEGTVREPAAIGKRIQDLLQRAAADAVGRE